MDWRSSPTTHRLSFLSGVITLSCSSFVSWNSSIMTMRKCLRYLCAISGFVLRSPTARSCRSSKSSAERSRLSSEYRSCEPHHERLVALEDVRERRRHRRRPHRLDGRSKRVVRDLRIASNALDVVVIARGDQSQARVRIA